MIDDLKTVHISIRKKRVRKTLVCYTSAINNTANQEKVAAHFDVIDMGFTTNQAAYNMKQLNPSLEIWGYCNAMTMQDYNPEWPEVNAHEDWFIHTVTGDPSCPDGERIRTCPFASYIMNPDPQLGWSDFFANDICKQRLLDYPWYDGIYGDNSHQYGDNISCVADPPNCSLSSPPCTMVSISDDCIPLNIKQNYPHEEYGYVVPGTWKYQHIQNVQNAIGNKVFMPNAGRCYSLGDITGYYCWEHLIHGRGHDLYHMGYERNYAMARWLEWEQLMQKDVNFMGIAGTKIPATPTQEDWKQIERWCTFTLCAMVIISKTPKQCYYSYNFFPTSGWQDGINYWPVMDYEFGDPIGAKQQDGQWMFWREYETCYVVVNMDTVDAYTITVDGQLVTLDPRTAIIIDK